MNLLLGSLVPDPSLPKHIYTHMEYENRIEQMFFESESDENHNYDTNWFKTNIVIKY